MQTDYIIVGSGLAGIAFAEELSQNNRSFVVFEDQSQNSSVVAGGMYNPVVLKRFTPVWNAEEQIRLALPFYSLLEQKSGNQYRYDLDIYRIFKSVEEQNNWFAASDKEKLRKYMIPEVIRNTNPSVKAPLGYGKLTNTGRIDTKTLVSDYRNTLQKSGKLKRETFDHSLIRFSSKGISYKGIEAGTIVFCEGFGLKSNPFFNYLPMQEAKGELITIKAPGLKMDQLLKAAVFVMPLGDDFYRVGATFNWKDKTQQPTEEGKKELQEKLETFINCEYQIVDQVAGIRPTVKDRRPLVGLHKTYKQLAVLNGLGTRGVIIAPMMARKLFLHLKKQEPLEREISIDRFA